MNSGNNAYDVLKIYFYVLVIKKSIATQLQLKFVSRSNQFCSVLNFLFVQLMIFQFFMLSSKIKLGMTNYLLFGNSVWQYEKELKGVENENEVNIS